MTVVQQGSVNTTSLVVPDVIVQIQPPQQNYVNGVPTNILGIVGTATWGPVGAPTIVGNMLQYVSQFGNIQARKYDMGTAVWASILNGANNIRAVRVTDGTDTAASVGIGFSGGLTGVTAISKYTGSLGNAITVTLANGSQANTWKAIIQLPGLQPEMFDNIQQGVGPLTATPGTGYTSVPVLTLGAPSAGGVQATATASLAVVTAAQAAGGSGYAVNDTVTLSNGVVLKVATVTTGAITGVTIQNGGSLTSGNTPANPVAQTSTSGAGTGATFTLTWGLGAATVTNSGTLYSVAPTVTVTGGGAGTGGAYTATLSYWANIAAAINNGVSGLRGPSQIIVATAGLQTAAPTAGATALSGGTDGAAGVGATQLLGTDGTTRTGMYSLRSTGCSVAMLADCDTSTSWTTQVAFGLSEGIYMIMAGPLGDNIANAVTTKGTAGIDSYAAKLLFGDWVYFNDTVNAQIRLVSPQGFVAGRLSALAPQESSLNKQLYGIVGTQKSSSNTVYSNADLQTLAQAGIDVIANPCPGGSYFGVRIGRNTSSNQVINGDNYPRMTFYIAYSLNAAMGLYIGRLQSASVRSQAMGTVNAFLAAMWQQNMIGDVSAPTKQPFSVQLDNNNNPPARVALGYLQVDCRITYLSVVTVLLINVEGGQSVSVNVASITPTS